jgi:molecular chaperone GrpE
VTEQSNSATNSESNSTVSSSSESQSTEEAKLKEQEAKYLYLYAEFDNFKKRAQKERLELMKFSWEPLALELLQIIDHLELALIHVPAGTDQAFLDGLKMILSQLVSTLEKNGVECIETQEKKFDPSFHEAAAHEESSQSAGTILKEFRKGYTLHRRLLRPARVAVSQGVLLKTPG